MSSTSFVGRASDLARGAELVESERLVTIVGVGGVGKTTLAMRVAQEVADRFDDGVTVAELTAITADETSSTAVAGALGFRSIDAAVDALRDRVALIVFDNCEHVIDLVAPIVQQLLGQCPSVHLLCTSRIPLQLQLEHVAPLQPLALSEGCELLRQRARAAGAEVGGDDEPFLALVARVDALPLALELAAIRLRSLEPNEIVQALDESLEFLQAHVGPEESRHSSLTRTIAWSHDLLDDEEAAALSALTVLPDLFDLDRAHAVVGDGESRLKTADLLDRLVTQSMLSMARTERGLRYRVLQSIQQFLAERSVSTADARERYIQFVAERSASIVQRALDRWSEDVIDDIDALAPDLLLAPRLCLDHDDDGQRTFMMMLPVWGLVHGPHAGEFASLGSKLIERWPDSTPGWGDIAAITATAHVRLAQFSVGAEIATDALKVGGLIAEPVARRVLGLVHQHRGDFVDALTEVERGYAAAQRLGLEPFAAELTLFRGALFGQLGRTEEALETAREARRHNRELASAPVFTWSLVFEAYLLDDVDRTESGRLLALAATEIDDDDRQWIIPRHLGILAAKHGDVDKAAHWFGRSLRSSRLASEVPHSWATLRWIAIAALTNDVQPADAAASLLAISDDSPLTPALGAFESEVADRARSVAEGQTTPIRAEDPFELAVTVLDLMAADRPAAPPVQSGEPPVVTGPAFLPHGQTWTLRWQGVEAEMVKSKGLADIAELLRRPRQEVSAVDLMGAMVVEPGVDPAIDDEARRDYEQRLRDLQLEVDAAESDNDRARAERAQAEFDQIVEALTSAYGLGGRPRRAGGSAEKARSAVTARIRAAFKKIDAELPGMAAHLRASVRTGAWCSYVPEYDLEWEL